MTPKSKKVPLFVGEKPVPDRVLLECKVLLRPDEVMDILRISRSTVYRMVNEGQLQGVKIAGALRVTSQSVIDAITNSTTS